MAKCSLSRRLWMSSMTIHELTKVSLMVSMTLGSESRPALKSVPLGQQLWSSSGLVSTTMKIGLCCAWARLSISSAGTQAMSMNL